MIRQLAWEATRSYKAFKLIYIQYRQSCLKEKDIEDKHIEEAWRSIRVLETPLRFSKILEIIADSYICQIREAVDNTNEIPEEMSAALNEIYYEALKLLSDIKLEEKEYRIKLTPHKIEKLISILRKIISPSQ